MMIRKLLGLAPRKYVYRSSVTGRYVSAEFAAANPATTMRIRVR